jgi:Ca-activated chloride channel family protein
MRWLPLFAIAAGLTFPPALAEPTRLPCKLDAMLVFDGSGSMAGTDMNSVTPHISKVREALAHVLPSIAPVRDLGLIVYGPGTHAKCDNIELRLRPAAHPAEEIMAEVNSVVPAGQTPLTASVRLAAEALQFRERAAQIVLLTDGEETCGGDPCELARTLRAEGRQLTVHVVGFRPRGTPTLDGPFKSRCLADETGGEYLSAETEEELIEALQKTLGCPFITKLESEGLVR